MDNLNITVESKDGGINIGKDVIKLTDQTTYTFKTDQIEAFVKYCADADRTAGSEIYYSTEEVELIDDTPDRYTESDATCTVVKHGFVKMLEKANDHDFGLDGFEEFLFTLRPFLDDAGRALYSYVRNFSATKVTSVKREVDNKGNYNYQVIREKGGPTDVQIPDKLTFTIPVISADILKPFTFDVFFTWKDNNNGCQVIFKLKNPLFPLDVDKAIRESLDKAMESLDCPKYWGSLHKVVVDNEWEYLFNGLDVKPPTEKKDDPRRPY